MKKKFRTITVGDVQYSWAVEEKNWPNLVLKVWFSKGHPWFEKQYEIHKDGAMITPAMVAGEIVAHRSLKD